MLDSLTVTLLVRLLQDRLCASKMVVGEVVPPKVIKIRNPLSCWIVRERWGLRVDTGKHLLGVSQLATLHEQLQTRIGRQVNTNTLVIWRGSGCSLHTRTSRQTLDEGIS
jgi:hypothetical protein